MGAAWYTQSGVKPSDDGVKLLRAGHHHHHQHPGQDSGVKCSAKVSARPQLLAHKTGSFLNSNVSALQLLRSPGPVFQTGQILRRLVFFLTRNTVFIK